MGQVLEMEDYEHLKRGSKSATRVFEVVEIEFVGWMNPARILEPWVDFFVGGPNETGS